MTDTPIIALYYREHYPMKRKMFLDQSIAAGEDEEADDTHQGIHQDSHHDSTPSAVILRLMLFRFSSQS